LIQLGFEDEVPFYQLIKSNPLISSWNKHPTEHPGGLYKFVSLELNFNKQKLVVNRETYGILEWLGDIGGLTDALILLGQFFLMPFNKFNLSSFLLTNLFRYQPSAIHASNPVENVGEKRIRKTNTFRA